MDSPSTEAGYIHHGRCPTLEKGTKFEYPAKKLLKDIQTLFRGDKKLNFEFSNRVKVLPPYLFAEMEKIVEKKRREGVDLISLGIGDPDLPPPKFILEALREEASNPKNHNYSSSRGEAEFRLAVSEWYKRRFNVTLDPEREVTALIGSKEGISNVARAFVNAGDRVLVPDPGYPVYANGGALLSDGKPISLPLLKESRFVPNLKKVDTSKVKMMYINYPNNPTGATLTEEEVKEIVDFALENKIILCYDNAYSEIRLQDYEAPSILQVDRAINVAIETNSFSKTFNLTGDRIGFAVGNSQLIEGLAKVKSQIDSGPSKYIQKVAVKGLEAYEGSEQPAYLRETNRIYLRRAKVLVEGLRALGFECEIPKATFYVWARCGGNSMNFVERMLKVNVVATPGIGFGRYGEGYIRFAVTCHEKRIKEACERLERIF